MFDFFYKLRNRNRNKKKGFTLIELIIVIAILAILAAILVPSMIQYQREAQQAVSSANARTAYSAAAAAAAFSQTKGYSVGTITLTDVPTLFASNPNPPTSFQTYVVSMLGGGFTGNVRITVTGNAVTQAEWSASGATGSNTGIYNPNTPTAAAPDPF